MSVYIADQGGCSSTSICIATIMKPILVGWATHHLVAKNVEYMEGVHESMDVWKILQIESALLHEIWFEAFN